MLIPVPALCLHLLLGQGLCTIPRHLEGSTSAFTRVGLVHRSRASEGLRHGRPRVALDGHGESNMWSPRNFVDSAEVLDVVGHFPRHHCEVDRAAAAVEAGEGRIGGPDDRRAEASYPLLLSKFLRALIEVGQPDKWEPPRSGGFDHRTDLLVAFSSPGIPANE